MKDDEKALGHLDHELSELQRRILRLEKIQSDLRLRGDSLQDVERMYAALAEQSADAIYLLKDGRFEYINGRFQELFGVSRDEMQRPDFDFMSLVAPESRQFISERLQRSLRGEPLSPRYEFTALTRDGRRFRVEASYAYIPYQGEIATQGAFRVLTRKDGESQRDDTRRDRVPASDASYRNFAEKAPFGIYRSSPDGRFLSINQAMASMFGYGSPEEMLGSISDIEYQVYVNFKDRLEFMRLLSEHGTLAGFECQYYRKDGSRIWVSESAWCERDPGGKTLYYQGVIEDITELKNGQDIYKLLAESSPVGVYVVQNGRFLLVNPQMVRYTGYPEQELLSKEAISIVHPEDREIVRRNAVRMLKGEDEVRPYEFRTITKDGRVRWVMETVRSIYYRHELAILGNYVDVTEQKEAHRQLEDLRASESSILASIPHAVFGLDDWKIVFVNDNVETVFGWKPDELIGQEIRVLFESEAEYSRLVEKVRAGLEKKPAVSMELESSCMRRDGAGIMCRISAAKMGHSDRKKTVATFEDITERKRAEEDLKESERRLKDIINFLPDPTFVINRQGQVIAWNRAIEGMTGIKAENILGKGDYEYAIPFFGERRPGLIDCVLSPDMEPDEGIESLYQNIKKLEYGITGESCIADINGRSAYLTGTAAALFDSKGNIFGAIQSIRDITDQKRAERAQKDLEAELLQAQKMEAIGTLAGGIAHDFNNLLMGIQGYTSLMLLGMEADHAFYKKLKSIEEQVQSGADLTRQLLGFARGGRYEVRPTDLNEIVEKTSLMFGRTKKEITIQKKLAKDLWLVDADIGQVEQVLLNLYVNSWQAMPGGGELFISSENVFVDEKFVLPFQTKPGHYVKISITDTGVGMDEKTRQRVFEPFFTTKEMGRGTGLGLASAYGIVKGHGGIINVYSEKGHGATFTIYLPASESQVIERRADRDEILNGNETILLVDDEETVIEVSREILETLGYKVLSASSGREAIELYEKRMDEIDLVILDMIIPEMSGGDIFDILRSINPAVRVILSSGYSMNGQAAKIMARGCRAFIQKPFSMREISHKVRDVLDRPETQANVQGASPEGDIGTGEQGIQEMLQPEEPERVVKLEFRKGVKYDLR